MIGDIKDEIMLEMFSSYNLLTHAKNIRNLVLNKRKQNQVRPTKLSERQKKNILRQTEKLPEEMRTNSFDQAIALRTMV